MTSKVRALFLGAALLAAGVACALIAASRTSGEIDSHPTAAAVASATPSTPASSDHLAPVLGSPSASQAQKTVVSTWSSGLKEALDGRAFATEAWKHPESGGRYYASYVADYCQGLREGPVAAQIQAPAEGTEGDVYVKKIAAFDRIKAFCEKFTDEELAAFAAAKMAGQKTGDSLFAASSRLAAASKARDSVARRTAIQEVLASQDPLLIDQLGPRLMVFPSATGGADFYFDGQRYPASSDPPVAAALYLLPCGLGLGCDALGDLPLTLQCATSSACYADRFEKARVELAGGDEAKYQRIMAAYQSMLTAVKAGEGQKFVPK